MVRATKFWNNGEIGTGTVITSYRSKFYGESVVIYARNPFGTHNLVVCVRDNWGALELWTAGNQNSLAFIRGYKKAYHKALFFLKRHGFEFKERDIKTIPSYRNLGAFVPYWQIKRDYLTPPWVLELDKYNRGGRIFIYPEEKKEYSIIKHSEEELEEFILFWGY